jgi:hypothetical protein
MSYSISVPRGSEFYIPIGKSWIMRELKLSRRNDRGRATSELINHAAILRQEEESP